MHKRSIIILHCFFFGGGGGGWGGEMGGGYFLMQNNCWYMVYIAQIFHLFMLKQATISQQKKQTSTNTFTSCHICRNYHQFFCDLSKLYLSTGAVMDCSRRHRTSLYGISANACTYVRACTCKVRSKTGDWKISFGRMFE
jgi:hypothetical protein